MQEKKSKNQLDATRRGVATKGNRKDGRRAEAQIYHRKYDGKVNVLKDRCTVTYTDDRLNIRREEVWALWDTGCDVTTISQNLAIRLKAEIIDGGMVNTAIGTNAAGATVVTITIGDIVVTWLPVRVVKFRNDDHPDLIIGMDIISQGRFEVDSSSGKTVLTFEI